MMKRTFKWIINITMIFIPLNIQEEFNMNTPKIRGFYKHFGSKWRAETKTKYKLCYKELVWLDIFNFIITTSQNHWYNECFSYTLKDLKWLQTNHWLSNIWYINIWEWNELFDFISKQEFKDLYISKKIVKICLFNNKKFEELKKVLDRSNKAKINYKSACIYSKIYINEDEIINKYKL
jgi:hypothetical protein